MTTIIILSVVVILVLIGATQRKKLAFLIKSEVNEEISKRMSSVKVLKQYIRDLKIEKDKIIEKAGDLFATIRSTEHELKELKDDLEKQLKKASKAKQKDNEQKALEHLKLVAEIEEQIKVCENAVKIGYARKKEIELRVQKIGNKIRTSEIKMRSLEVREATNKALKSSYLTNSIIGESMDEVAENCNKKLDFEDAKLDYQIESEDSDKEEVSEKIKEMYNNL